MKLEPIEVQSALWTKVSNELNNRLRLARLKNDGALNEIETADLRGQIKALKNVLALGDLTPRPTTVMEDE
jgi:hypothetical protein